MDLKTAMMDQMITLGVNQDASQPIKSVGPAEILTTPRFALNVEMAFTFNLKIVMMVI